MTTMNVEKLAKENVKLYEENIRLRLLLGTSSIKNTKSNTNKTTKNETKKTTSKGKTRKTTVKENKNETLSKFQQEREAKKSIVLAKRLEKVPVPEIAKAIGQSEPTVRNYIRELRVEGKLAK